MSKRVWILGAGASKDMRYPLGNEVMCGIYEMIENELQKSQGERNNAAIALWEMVGQVAPKIYREDSGLDEVDFEDYVSRVRILEKGYYPAVFFDKPHNDSRILSVFLRLLYWYGMQLWELTKNEIENGILPDRKKPFLNL